MLTVIEALSLLTPYDVNARKERVRPACDGGYVLLPDLFTPQPVFSYGVNGEYRFDIEMAGRGNTIMMFDHTISGIHNPENDPKLRFIKEGVGGTHDPEQMLNTIDNHLAAYASQDDSDMILKMDVEGYEYEAFDSISSQNLCRFQQLVFEIHAMHSLEDPAFRERFVRVLTKINRHFTLFHVHPNNFDGTDTYTFLSGVPVCNLLELSYVRSDLVTRSPSTTLYPTHLDYPNVHPLDKKLWFYPFLPTTIPPGQFAEADKYMKMVGQLKNSGVI